MNHAANIYRATEADLNDLVQRMRPADRRELLQWTGQDALWGVQTSLRQSDIAFAGYAPDGQLLSIFGAKRDNLIDRTALLWELSTISVDTHRLTFLANTKICFDLICQAMTDVEEFHNYVSLEYTGAIRWIEWLGGALAMHGRRQGLCGGVFNEFYIPNPLYKENEPCA